MIVELKVYRDDAVKPICPACHTGAEYKHGPYPTNSFSINRLNGPEKWCLTIEDGRLYRYVHDEETGPYWGNK